MEKALIFHTDWTAEEVDIEINNGKGLIKYGEPIGDKEFILDQVRPFVIKGSGFMSKNKLLYLLKWDKVRPANFTVEPTMNDNYMEVGFKSNGNEYRETLAPFNPSFGEQRGDFKDMTPDMIRQSFDLRFLQHLKRYSTEEGSRFKLGKGKGLIAAILFITVFGLTTLASYAYLGGFG
jgi:hypothetical protein